MFPQLAAARDPVLRVPNEMNGRARKLINDLNNHRNTHIELHRLPADWLHDFILRDLILICLTVVSW